MWRWQFADEFLISCNLFGVVGHTLYKREREECVKISVAPGKIQIFEAWTRRRTVYISKLLIVFQRYDRVGEMVEVSTEDIRSVMDGEAGPVELAAICRWRIKDELQFRDAFG